MNRRLKRRFYVLLRLLARYSSILQYISNCIWSLFYSYFILAFFFCSQNYRSCRLTGLFRTKVVVRNFISFVIQPSNHRQIVIENRDRLGSKTFPKKSFWRAGQRAGQKVSYILLMSLSIAPADSLFLEPSPLHRRIPSLHFFVHTPSQSYELLCKIS